MENMIPEIVQEARNAAHEAATKYLNEKLGGQDAYACGFAWVTVNVKGSTKIGKALIKNGFRKSYYKGLEMRNPSGLSVQNINVKEAGAEAAAQVFKKYGIDAYMGSRLD